MSTQVERFRDHCRRMADAEHKPKCPMLTATPPSRLIPRFDEDGQIRSLAVDLNACTWRPPHCPGCNPPDDRALFARLAGEADAYLQGDLFEETP